MVFEAVKGAPAEIKSALKQLEWVTEVFVSYAHLDAVLVDAVCKRIKRPLNQRFIHLYIDKERLKPGDPWSEELQRKLDRVDCALGLSSPNFYKSKFINQRELRRILERIDVEKEGLRFFLVRLSESKAEKRKDLSRFEWFPKDCYLAGKNGALTPGMLRRCERELVKHIAYNISKVTECSDLSDPIITSLTDDSDPPLRAKRRQSALQPAK